MPFPFSELCTLLNRYEDLEQRDPPILHARDKLALQAQTTTSWFRSHRRAIHDASEASTVALLSTLLPERRVDRVYELQAPRLARLLARTLRLGASRTADLQAYTRPGAGDLAVCLERVLRAGGPPALPPVTLEDVDVVLQRLAGYSQFSATAVTKDAPPKIEASSSAHRETLLASVMLRFQPFEAKWFVRVVLKDFSPVRVDELHIIREVHFLLPDLLRFQNDFASVVALLKGPLREYPDHPDPRSERLHRLSVAKVLMPVVGIKVGRPEYVKARSIEHCSQIVGQKPWVLERKYDGEYCEIHIDMTVSSVHADCIKIFSKSGKESTLDRKALIPTLLKSLLFGSSRRKIQQQAILLGELVVYSDQQKSIMPFEEIRKHVSRSGRFIGTNLDSALEPTEHLAIVFFDLLLLDNVNVMVKPVEERRSILRQAYQKIPGHVMGAEWKIVDFQDEDQGRKRLIEQFAASIAQRCEGLVLKPCGVPYFPVDTTLYQQCFIKVKKDYMANLGDEADMAVIGASYNAQQAQRSNIQGAKWTTFHLGCLTNKDEVLRFDHRPRFRHVGTISHESCIPSHILRTIHSLGAFSAQPYNPTSPGSLPFGLDARSSQVKIEDLFNPPFIFEVLGSGFEKPSNCNFLMLRHPRVKKLHQDRSWKDCISFQELQTLAHVARDAPVLSESQETREWIARLERKWKRKIEKERRAESESSGNLEVDCREGSVDEVVRDRMEASVDQKSVSGSTDAGRTILNKLNKRVAADGDADSCPSAKRRAVSRTREGHYSKEIASPTITTTPTPTPTASKSSSHSSRSSPLRDITAIASNHALQRLATTEPPPPPPQPTNLQSSIQNQPKFRFPPSRLPVSLIRFYQPLTPPSTPPQVSTSACRNSKPPCLFAHAAVYLAPCIATTLYITHDLLSHHHISRIGSLEHWALRRPSPPISSNERSASPVSSSRSTSATKDGAVEVEESQPDAGKRIILVERKRHTAVQAVVQEALALQFIFASDDVRVGGSGEVEVWDWRVLEHRLSHDADGASVRREFLLGYVRENSRRGNFWDGGGIAQEGWATWVPRSEEWAFE